MKFIYMSSMNFIHIEKNKNFVLDDGKTGGIPMFTSPAEMDDFDNAVRAVLKAQQERLNLTDEALGKIAFGFMGGRRTKVQAIFVGQGADKYRKLQKLRLTDVMNLSEALGKTFQETMRDAQKLLKEKSGA